MNIEYHSSFPIKLRWQLPWPLSPLGRRITVGFWVQETADRVFQPTPQHRGCTYQYKPLEGDNQKRLFLLEPGTMCDPLVGEFMLADIDEDDGMDKEFPSYEALSYIWGPPENVDHLNVGGQETISIRRPLGQALRYLRHERKARLLWIDQLCINQDDMNERSQQVSRMMDIYAKATSVVVWLGQATEYSAVGMECIAHMARNVNDTNHRDTPPWVANTLALGPKALGLGDVLEEEQFKFVKDNWPTTLNDEVSPWNGLLPPPVSAGLQEVLSREWFKRAWVMQEAAVAKRVIMMCGSDIVQWPTIWPRVRSFIRSIKAAAISEDWRNRGLGTINMDALLAVLSRQLVQGPNREMARRRRRAPDLLDIMYETRNLVCSDPRDRVYAFMGLVEPEDRIDVDYSESVEELHTRLMVDVHQELRDLGREAA